MKANLLYQIVSINDAPIIWEFVIHDFYDLPHCPVDIYPEIISKPLRKIVYDEVLNAVKEYFEGPNVSFDNDNRILLNLTIAKTIGYEIKKEGK